MAEWRWHAVWIVLTWGTVHPVAGGTIPPIDSNAYQVIRARHAVVRHGDVEQAAPASLYDGSGLTRDNPLLAQHGADPDTIWQYPLQADAYPISVEFDLGAEYLINEFWLWQLPGPDLEGQGLSEFNIVMRDGGGREVGRLPGALDQFNRVGVQPVQRFNAFGECVFFPVPDCIRYIELTIHQNRGDPQWVGLAEVLFAGWAKPRDVPEPSFGVLGWLTVVVLGIRRSRAAECRRGFHAA